MLNTANPYNRFLRQIARSINNSNHESGYVKPTLIDRFYGLELKYDLLCVPCASYCFSAYMMMARAYNDGNKAKRTCESTQINLRMFQTVKHRDKRVF